MSWRLFDYFLPGTLQAACKLVQQAGGEVLECVLLVELVELNGKSKVPAPCFSLVQFWKEININTGPFYMYVLFKREFVIGWLQNQIHKEVLEPTTL